MSENALEFTSDNFDMKVLQSEKPVLVDFWAEWCGPCKMLSPTIDALASEFSDKYAIGKLNVDNNSDIATKYGIRSIPCLLFFKDGKVEKQIVGAIDKNEIADILESL
jgi:thioredoxin 1